MKKQSLGKETGHEKDLDDTGHRVDGSFFGAGTLLLWKCNGGMSGIKKAEGPKAGRFETVLNEENFPDAIFRKYVKKFDRDKDGVLSTLEKNEVKEINVSNKGISSLEGLRFFTEIEKLNCSNNKLDGLDVTQNVNLRELCCASNFLTELDVSQNVNLELLDCRDNRLTALNITMIPQPVICLGDASLKIQKNIGINPTNFPDAVFREYGGEKYGLADIGLLLLSIGKTGCIAECEFGETGLLF